MTPTNKSIGQATYNGYRLNAEPEDGGPEYLTADEWPAQDQEAWDNAARWALHFGLGGVSVEDIVKHLEAYRDLLESMESTGYLEVGLPISDTDATSYSGEVRAVLDSLGTRL